MHGISASKPCHSFSTWSILSRRNQLSYMETLHQLTHTLLHEMVISPLVRTSCNSFFHDWYDSCCGKNRCSIRMLAQKQKSAAGASGGVACGLIQIQRCSRASACDAPGQYPGERQGFLLPYSIQEGREGCSCPRAAVHCGSARNLRWQEGSQQLACVPNLDSQLQAVIY